MRRIAPGESRQPHQLADSLAAVGLLGLLLLMGGCGSTVRNNEQAHTGVPTCRQPALQLLERLTRISVLQSAQTLSAEESECRLRTRGQQVGAVEVLVRIDSSPQPHYRLERQAVEDSQVFTPHRLLPAPEEISGIGKGAYWFPAEESLLSTEDTHLFTVKVNWPHSTRHERRALAIAITRAYI